MKPTQADPAAHAGHGMQHARAPDVDLGIWVGFVFVWRDACALARQLTCCFP